MNDEIIVLYSILFVMRFNGHLLALLETFDVMWFFFSPLCENKKDRFRYERKTKWIRIRSRTFCAFIFRMDLVRKAVT